MEENNFDNQINFGKELPNRPGMFEYSIIIFLVKVYLIENEKEFLIKEGDSVNKEFSFAEDYLKAYDRFIELTFGDIYVRQCAKDLEELKEKKKKIQRVINENNQKVLISSETKRWNSADYCIRFIKRHEKGGVEETLMPGKIDLREFKKSFNSLKRKLAEKCPLQEIDIKFLPVPAEFKFPIMYDSNESFGIDSNSSSPTSVESISSLSTNITSSSFEISISSQSSAEKNQATQHVNPNKSQSQIPILSRNNSTSSFRDGSKNGSLKLISRSNTGASLFSNNSRTESPKIFKFDITGRLVILSKNHPFLEKIKSGRKKIPQSYRDAIRIDNLTDNEMDDLSNNYVNKTIAVGKPSSKA